MPASFGPSVHQNIYLQPFGRPHNPERDSLQPNSRPSCPRDRLHRSVFSEGPSPGPGRDWAVSVSPHSSKNPSRGLQFYAAHLKEQNYTIELGEDVATLSAALAKMPHIQKIILTNHWSQVNDSSSPRSYVIETQPTREDCGAPLCRHYPEDVTKPEGHQLAVDRSDDGYIGPYEDHGFAVICRALSITKTKLQSLVIDYSPTSYGSTGISMHTFHVYDRELTHYCNAFWHLRKLHLSLEMGKSSVLRK